jgi:hypothetical protein
MSTEIRRPWVPTELTPPVQKKTLSMQMAEVLAIAYGEDIENTFNLVTTTDNEDSPEGTPDGADWALTFVLRRLAQALPNGAERWPDLVKADAAAIHRNLHYAKNRVSPDLVRAALVKAKADYKALLAAEPAGSVDEPAGPTLDSQRQEEQPDAE